MNLWLNSPLFDVEVAKNINTFKYKYYFCHVTGNFIVKLCSFNASSAFLREKCAKLCTSAINFGQLKAR